MKLNFSILIGTIALAIASCNTTPPSTPASSSVQTASSPTSETTAASPAGRSGTFVAGEKSTQGTASIVTENGQNYLVLDDTFKTGDGPDVFVLLHKEDVPKSYPESDYVSLGMLQKTSGTQRYLIPTTANVADFRSVVIWCRQFSATFGYASLGN
jgi:ABC-type Fe3+-hydroxamate transport system substrate-binding protein